MSLCARAVCLGTLWVGLANLAVSAIIVDDDFSTTKHPSNFRTVPAPGLGGIPFYTRYSPTATSTASISGGELIIDSPSTNFPMIGLLPGTVNLTNVGDTVSASFNFRFLNAAAATDSNSSFRFGLHSSNGTPITGDAQGVSDNDTGYYVQIGDAAQTNNNLMFQETGGQGTITNGNDRGAPTATGGIPAITDTANHSALLSITRNSSTTMLVSLTIDSTTVTGSFTTLYTSLDEISFANGFSSPTLSYAIDNLVIDASNFTAVPEPSTYAILAGVVGLLALRRRQKISVR
jgi:hypothetical protein